LAIAGVPDDVAQGVVGDTGEGVEQLAASRQQGAKSATMPARNAARAEPVESASPIVGLGGL
jgi:hypothetical protein